MYRDSLITVIQLLWAGMMFMSMSFPWGKYGKGNISFVTPGIMVIAFMGYGSLLFKYVRFRCCLNILMIIAFVGHEGVINPQADPGVGGCIDLLLFHEVRAGPV